MDGGGAAGHLVEVSEFALSPGKADLQSFDFAVPSLSGNILPAALLITALS